MSEALPQPDPRVLAETQGRRIPRPVRTPDHVLEEHKQLLAKAKAELDVLIREIDGTNPNRTPIQFFKKEDWRLRAAAIRQHLDRITL